MDPGWGGVASGVFVRPGGLLLQAVYLHGSLNGMRLYGGINYREGWFITPPEVWFVCAPDVAEGQHGIRKDWCGLLDRYW